jgi:hypothetical protein
MTELIFEILDAFRPWLFLAGIAYVPMKIGVSFDVAGMPPSPNEIRMARNVQLSRIRVISPTNIFLFLPRLIAIIYFSVWLFIDRGPLIFLGLFLLTTVPVYFR